MELRNEKYTVISDVKVNPQLEQYDVIHNTEKVSIDDFCMARTFQLIRNDGHSAKVALIDLICSSYVPYAVLDRNILTVILFSAIIRINMDTGVIVQYEECDNMGGLFEIHPIDGGYLIWGEGDVFRYDLSLNRVWRFQEEIFLFHYKVTKTFGLSMAKSTAGTFLYGITFLILTGS